MADENKYEYFEETVRVSGDNNNQTNKTNSNKNSSTNENIDVSITKETNYGSPELKEIADFSKYLVRGKEKGIINPKTNSSMVIRQNGQINLAASKYSQYKLNPSGKAMEMSLESVTLTNRKKISSDDIVINEHKINPFLYELTDMKELSNYYNNKMLVGNFTVFGTVLVKAWDHELKRYVLLRRLARMPMFSPVLNVPEIHPGLNISDPLKVDHNILAKSDKGYQVNKPLHDRNSLIGKNGVDRSGINRFGGSSSGGTIYSGQITGGNIPEMVWNALIGAGFTANGAAGLMGNFEAECHFNIELRENKGDGGGTDFNVNDGHGYGLAQWTDASRKQKLLDKARAMNSAVSDLRVQVSVLFDEMADRTVDTDICTARIYGISCAHCAKNDGRNLLDVCKNSNDYVESCTVFHDIFERSNDYDPNQHGGIESRISYARSYLEEYGKGKK